MDKENSNQTETDARGFGACGRCHERESSQEKVMRHQLCKARMWEQSPREKGGLGGGGGCKARTRKRDRERKRERAQGPRGRERVGSEPTVPHQKGQCDREKAVKE